MKKSPGWPGGYADTIRALFSVVVIFFILVSGRCSQRLAWSAEDWEVFELQLPQASFVFYHGDDGCAGCNCRFFKNFSFFELLVVFQTSA